MRIPDWVYQAGVMINFFVCMYNISIGRWDQVLIPALAGLTLEIARNLR